MSTPFAFLRLIIVRNLLSTRMLWTNRNTAKFSLRVFLVISSVPAHLVRRGQIEVRHRAFGCLISPNM